jgi:DNA-directed RNA polymerase specialized sigma24 family protein
MDENQLLKDLVAQAQAHPDRSPRRRIALTKLLSKISESKDLSKQVKWREIPNFQDIYNEALNRTLIEISERIDNYNPNHAVMAWVNNTFNYRFLDAYNKDKRKGITNLPSQERPPIFIEIDKQQESDDGKGKTREISDPSETDKQHEFRTLEEIRSASLREFIQADPGGELAKKHLKNLPHVTFQKILLMICDDLAWQEIADACSTHESEVSVSTLSCFYQRKLHETLPYFKENLLKKVID